MKKINYSLLALSLLLPLSIGITGCGSSKKSSNASIVLANRLTFESTSFTTDDVARLYIGTLNSPPTYAQMNSMMQMNSIADIADSLKPDLSIYTPNDGPRFVNALYKNVFGREATDSEVANWVNKFNHKIVTTRNIFFEFENSASGADAKTLENKVEAAKYYADLKKGEDYSLINITDDNETLAKAKEEIYMLKNLSELFPNSTISLTPDEDTVTGTGGFDVIEGKVMGGSETLQDYDYIDGGAGRDILRATVIDGSSPTIENVEEAQFRFAGSDDNAVIDLVNTDGIKFIKVYKSTKAGTVDNVTNHSDYEISSSQHDITFKNGNATKLNLDIAYMGRISTNNDVNITFKDNLAEELDMNLTNSNVSYKQDDQSVSSAYIDIYGDNIIDLDAGKDTLKEIYLTNKRDESRKAGVDLTFDSQMDMFTALEELSASQDVGNVKVHVDNSDGATLSSIVTASGTDEILLKTDDEDMKSNLNINAGGGDDTVIIMANHASHIPQTAIIDGGAGMNKLGLSSAVATTMEDGKQEEAFNDFHVMMVVDKLDGTVNMQAIDDIQNVVLYNMNPMESGSYTDGSEIQGLESGAYITLTEDVDDNGGDTTLTLSGDTTQESEVDFYNINLVNTEDTDFGNIRANYIETLNIIANDGASHKLTITADSVKTINVSGTAKLDMSEYNLSTVTKFTAGDAGVLADLSGGDVTQTVITGAGDDNISLSDTDGQQPNSADLGQGDDVLTGGYGDDKVDLGSGNDIYYSSGGSDEIILGTGRDTYVARDANNSNSDHVDKIIDFVSGEDILDFSRVIKADNSDGGNYVGEVNGYGSVISSLKKDDNIAQAVLDADDNKLYIDIDDDGDFSANDMLIDLSGNKDLKSLRASDFKFQ